MLFPNTRVLGNTVISIHKLTAPFRKLERGYQEPGLLAVCFCCLDTFVPCVKAQLNMLFSRTVYF